MKTYIFEHECGDIEVTTKADSEEMALYKIENMLGMPDTDSLSLKNEDEE